MDFETLYALLLRLIATDEKHCDYDVVCTVAADCRAYVTNKGLESKIKRIKSRESDQAIKQRTEITQQVIKPVVSSLRKPFYKVARNDKPLKKVDLQDETKLKAVSELDQAFYGTRMKSKKGSSGLTNWLKTRFVSLSFIDPNAWVVAEWGDFDAGELPRVNPFEVKAHEAVNFEYVDGKLSYLLVKKAIKYKTGNHKSTEKKIPTAKDYAWTIYGDQFTIVYTRVDDKYIATNPQEVPANGTIMVNPDNGYTYVQQVFNHKLGIVPAFRVGYHEDETTDGRTYVAPYDDATPFFNKLIQAVSELDLTIALHTFPQKIQYIQKCPGKSREEPCFDGKSMDGTTCEACKGSGVKFHTSAQDSIVLPMPKDKEDMIDLNEIMVYKGPPIETVQFQSDYVDRLEVKCHTAVFNSTVFVQATIVKTATEKEQDMDSVHDTLFPFAAKVSDMWEAITSVFVAIAGGDLAEVAVKHIYPGDLKLKTMTQLLNDLKSVNDSGAPSYLRDKISRDIAEQACGGDADEMVQYDVKHRFFPFNGKTVDEINTLLSLDFVPRFNKVLYGSFELIFTEIEKDTPGFYLLDFKKQWDIVGKKVNAIMDDLDKAAADRFTAASFTTDTPAPGARQQQQQQQADDNPEGGNQGAASKQNQDQNTKVVADA